LDHQRYLENEKNQIDKNKRINLPRLSVTCGCVSDILEWGTDRELDRPLPGPTRMPANSDIILCTPLPRGAPELNFNK
jgi:hypothetical protein